MRFFTTTILILISFLGAIAQKDSTNLVKYDFSFTFKDGIYPNFNSFKNNDPIPPESIISPDYSDDFYNKLDTAQSIIYYGKFGSSISIPVRSIWGYSKNGKPYILWADKFNLIPYVGQITHFVSTVTVYYSSYQDPFYNSYHYNSYSRGYQSEELRQFIIDMQTGKIIDYNLKNIETILKRDIDIYNDFMKLRKRKRNKQMFYFIKLYNEKNHLFIPE
ncbi:MAG: hypothetical protein PHW82_16600 [Bacteroidales bacterium]|nr:hypothetical protein [Bacteroidales bacterium]